MVQLSPPPRSLPRQPLTLNLGTGSIAVQLPEEAVREIKATLDEMMLRLKAVVSSGNGAGRASTQTPQKSVEYRYRDQLFLELFCNPNIWPTPFAAKVLITLKDEHLRLSTEADLSQLFEDVNHYLEQV